MALRTAPPPGLRDPKRRTVSNPLFKDVMHWTKYSVETDGAYTEAQGIVGPGGGNPLHYHHNFVETFTAVRGRLGVTLGKREIILSPGESVTIPIGTVHRFYNPSDTEEVEMRTRLEPGMPDFERGIHIVYGLAADGLTDKQGVPTSMVHLAIFMRMTDIHLAGRGLWLMTPVFAVLCWYGRWTREEERLVRKYWG